LTFLAASIFASSLALGGLGAYLSPQALRAVREAALRRYCRDNRKLVLTFDDGPGRPLTPRLLDLLARHRVHATFFLLGRNVPGNEDLVERIVREGHEVGCHGQDHRNALRTAPWLAVRDIAAGFRTLAPWLRPGAAYRPPYGKLSLVTWLVVVRRKIPLGWWTVDSGDTHERRPGLREVLASTEEGGIVLFHDHHRSDDGIRFILETCDAVLHQAEDRGLDVCRLGDLLAGKAARCRIREGAIAR
jgi:peptidoglycan-N-acetylglucosamine deacetylase